MIYEEQEILGDKIIKKTSPEGRVYWIPTDPANSDYAEYLRYTEWVEAGNKPEDFWTQNESEI